MKVLNRLSQKQKLIGVTMGGVALGLAGSTLVAFLRAYLVSGSIDYRGFVVGALESAAGALVLSTLVMLGFARRLQPLVTAPIVELARTVEKIAAEKNYAMRAPKHADDEIGQLIDRFNDMLGEIQAREQQLQAARNELERRVEERTRELAREQARFRVIFEAVPIGITWMSMGDIASRIVNPAHARITGVPAEFQRELPRYREATFPDDRGKQDELHRRLLAGEIGHYEIEKRYVHPDGARVWVALSVMLVRQGDSVQEINTLVDITERKRAEMKFAEASELLETLLENSTDTIYFKDLKSRFVRVSRSKIDKLKDRFADLRAIRAQLSLPVDVPESELLSGLTDFDTYQGEDAKIAFADEQEIIRTGKALIDKLERQVFLDGKACWHLTSKMPWRNTAGQIIGTFGLSKDVTAVKEAEARLDEMHRQLLDASRHAGMAEIATGVLHNVGNVLNSVNVSATVVIEQVRHTRAKSIAKLSALLSQHKADLAEFLTRDSRGQMIPAYVETLAEAISTEHETVIGELEQLHKNIEHIKDIVAMQQAYARTAGVLETISVPDIIEDALRMNAGSLARHEVQTLRDYQARPVVTTDKHKVIQILINLVRNAKYACDESGRADKKIIVRTTAVEKGVNIAVIDNGVGIPPENLDRIFTHGFTTRASGHGFGLHSGALAAKELGGSLTVASDGPGQGATFTLFLPSVSESRL